MPRITNKTVNKITAHIHNGNWEDAQSLIQYRCGTKPERQAYRLTRVVVALIDDGYDNLAYRLLDRFDKE